ncbi:ester cyclase [Natrinema gelatinilyticum]|uniref:ester cyclase n=1 Tax=Natrinema gelatinilyticum TaxID=2961571 RepID=UPI0020C4A619|nr:ester cyclase [Natrinema gelatinilyticum]
MDSPDELKSQVEETNERIFNRGDIDYVDEVYAEDMVMHNVAHGEDYEGREAFKEWITDLRDTFPDFEVEILDTIVEDDTVVTRYLARGTHEGPLPPFNGEPTNEKVEFEGVTIHAMDGTKATEAWWYYDQLTTLTQLGIVPETPPM